MTKAISLLGSTGSIGRQTLDVCRELNIRVEALTAHSNIDLLEEQTRHFMPRLVVLFEEESAKAFAHRIVDLKDVRVIHGEDGLVEAASMPESDTVVTAVVGRVGLRPTLAAIEKGKRIALANKETLVCAGELVMEAARRYNAEIIPVDSEHSAIFQCLQGSRREDVKRLILTCSGGPFFGMTKDEVATKTRADALRHPNWKMGEKITIDCATLMNKGLEYIEAMRLFGTSPEEVSVVIHRQSIIHSMVEYRDGSVIAQMGTPDMRLPIRYALTYPTREKSPLPPLDLLNCPPLTFHEPDLEVFPALRLAIECARTGGTSCAVMNAANEEAVGLFLNDRISFGQIPELVAGALEAAEIKYHPDLEMILEADRFGRRYVLDRCN